MGIAIGRVRVRDAQQILVCPAQGHIGKTSGSTIFFFHSIFFRILNWFLKCGFVDCAVRKIYLEKSQTLRGLFVLHDYNVLWV